MNFTITIHGEKNELADGLAILKAVMGGQIGGGSVAAILAEPAVQNQPSYQQPQAIAPHIAQQNLTPDPAATYQTPMPLGYGQTQVQQGYGQQQPIQQGYEQQPGQVPIAPAPTYTIERLGVAAGPLIDAGRSPELSSWITQRGAGALTQLDKSHYGDFATYLRSLGGNI